MVELTLVFLLGVLVAGLVWLLVLPLVWHRAERLTRERLERALPLNINEVLAERDRERAVFAVRALEHDQRLQAMRDEVLCAKREVGAGVLEKHALLERLAAVEAAEVASRGRMQGVEQDLAALKASAAASEAERDEALARLAALGDGKSMLEARLAETLARLENERRLRDEAEVHAQTARDAEAEERARAQALRAELASRQQSLRDALHGEGKTGEKMAGDKKTDEAKAPAGAS